MVSDPQTPNSSTSRDTSNDKLLAALSYPIPIIGIVILVSDTMKNDPFLRTHAVQSIALGVVLLIITTVLGISLILACLAPIVWLVPTLYYAYQAYQGKSFSIPVITDFCKNQKWI